MRIIMLVPSSRFSRNVARDLLYGCWCKGKRIAGTSFPPVPQALLATILKRRGQEAYVIDAQAQGLSLDRVKSMVSKGQVLLVVLTSTMTVVEDAAYLKELKSVNQELKTVLFGAHPTFMPEYTLGMEGVDFIIRGEAEASLSELADACRKGTSEYGDIKGIGFVDPSGKNVLTGPRPFIEDLDGLPFADRSMIDPRAKYFNPLVKRLPYTTAFTSRGCPGKCVFCSSPSFYGRKIRYRSAESVVEELSAVRLAGYREVFFRDEIFTVSGERTVKICEGIMRRRLDIGWVCSSRVGSVDKPAMALMKRAGCHLIRFGVESGDQKILDNINKGISLDDVRRTFRWANECGLDTHAHFMIGLPGENRDTMEKSLKFAREIRPSTVTFGLCTPYPGTELFDMVKAAFPEVGDGAGCDLSKLHTHSFYSNAFTSLDPRDLEAGVRKAYRSFYLRPGYILGWIRRLTGFGEFKRAARSFFSIFDFIFCGDDCRKSVLR